MVETNPLIEAYLLAGRQGMDFFRLVGYMQASGLSLALALWTARIAMGWRLSGYVPTAIVARHGWSSEPPVNRAMAVGLE